MDKQHTYSVNQIFYSIQGEGIQQGVPMTFIRFAGCNLSCSVNLEGFDCDTDFSSGRKLSVEEIMEEVKAVEHARLLPSWILLTGGEPMLQVDWFLMAALKNEGYHVAIETNGTIPLPDEVASGMDWITVSPKATHTIRQSTCNELRVVRSYGQPLPKIPASTLSSGYKVVSPAASGETVPAREMQWCIQLVKENRGWRLSVPLHKRAHIL